MRSSIFLPVDFLLQCLNVNMREFETEIFVKLFNSVAHSGSLSTCVVSD